MGNEARRGPLASVTLGVRLRLNQVGSCRTEGRPASLLASRIHVRAEVGGGQAAVGRRWWAGCGAWVRLGADGQYACL